MTGWPALSIARREAIAAMLAVSAAPLEARRSVPIRASPIRWTGAAGRTLHGYMAIPGRARGRQPAVIVIGSATALPPAPDPDARRIVDALAEAGLVACTADNVTGTADLAASLAWLRGNRYATGRVALVAYGGGIALADRVARAGPSTVAALLVLGEAPAAPPVPTLALVPNLVGGLPPGAVAFLKEHLA